MWDFGFRLEPCALSLAPLVSCLQLRSLQSIGGTSYYIIVDLKTGFLGKDGWSLLQKSCE